MVKRKYDGVGAKEPLSLSMNSEGTQGGYGGGTYTNGTDNAKEPLAIAVSERKFGQT